MTSRRQVGNLDYTHLKAQHTKKDLKNRNTKRKAVVGDEEGDNGSNNNNIPVYTSKDPWNSRPLHNKQMCIRDSAWGPGFVI